MKTRLIILVGLAGAALLGFQFLWKEKPPASGTAIVKVTVPSLTGLAKDGEPVFNEKCSSCHGKNAAGREGVAPPLVHIIYEPNHHGDRAFVLAAKNGVIQHHWRFGNMPPVEGVSETDMTKIITYVRTLQRANGIQ